MNRGVARQRQGTGRHDQSGMIPGMLAKALEHHRAGQLTEAEKIYRDILAIDARQADSLHLLGMIAYQAGSHEDAVTMIKSAIAINNRGASYHSNLGTVLQAQGKLKESAASYERALALKPDLAEVHTNLGNILRTLNKLDQAVACHERALALKPDLTEARYNLGLAQLQQGNFASGWANFERRWQTANFGTPMREYTQPLWTGGKLPSGRLLIWGEQGVGDEIMFAGLIPEAICAGNRCVLDCDARLQPLFARSFPGIDVISQHDAGRSPEMEIAAHLPSGSLPGLFRTNLAAFAATRSSYLCADTIERQRFRERYTTSGARKRQLIGLAWHTNNPRTGRYRSIDLSALAPLFERTDLRWISLQYGDPSELENQVASAGAPIHVDRAVDQLTNIDLFAAQVAAMDLVITIDNSTAHLAGALGIPTFVLLPFAPDWRWLQSGEDSPWYPTLRLFRQSEQFDWQTPIKQILRAL